MGTTVGGKKIATKKSGHQAVAPPAMSNIPPMAPPTPTGVPAPFPYTAQSSSGSDTSSKLVIGGGETLVEGSGMDVAPPGNQPSQPAPMHDVVTMQVNAKVTVMSGSSKVKAGGKGVAADGDTNAMNVATVGSKVSQTTGPLLPSPDTGTSSADSKSAEGSGQTAGEPVNVVTGEVVDDMVDMSLPGLIPVEWKRIYSSGFSDETSPLGRGGWTFSLHQWIEPRADRLVLRNENGRNLHFTSAFHRGKRLEVSQTAPGVYCVSSLDTRLVRVFAAVVQGGPAVLREIRDSWGNRVELRYFDGRLTTIVDTAGRELRLTYDERGRIVRVDAWAEGAVCQTMTYAYSDVGELASATDALGHTEWYAYDGKHRMVKKTLTNGVRFYYVYDEETGRCVKTWGDGGIHPVALEFDLTERSTVIHGTEEPRKFLWNDKGSVLREETIGGEWAIAKTLDADLYVVEESNAAGEATQSEYDARGNLVRQTDPAGNVTEFEYRGDVLVRRVGPDGLAIACARDGHGSLTQVKYPNGVAYSLFHDNRGRLAAVQSIEGPFLTCAYDNRHNLVREVDARGAATIFTYDPLGRPLTRTDALGRVTRVEYDAVGNLVAIHNPDGTRTTLEYDGRRNAVRIVDALGQATVREFTGTGVLSKQTMPNGLSWLFKYDSMERLAEVQNPMFERYEFRYDWAGRVRKETTFDGRTLQYQYNKADRLTRVEYPDETWRAFQYDPLGNVVLETSPHGAQKYKRDKLGRLVEATVEEYSGKVVVGFERDELGRVIATSQNGQTIRYTYDPLGRRTSRVLPGGETTKYAYDPGGGLVGLDHDGHAITIQRDALGREVRKHIHRGGTDVFSAYDTMDRLLEQSVAAPSPLGDGSRRALSHRRWTYDGLGRVTSIDDARWGTTRYAYDEIGQLVQAVRGTHREVFDYDAAGSLQAILPEVGNTIHPWTVRTGNLLVHTKDADYEYDQNHRRKKEIRCKDHKPTGEVTEYFWDCRDRLREVALPDGTRALYTYDAFGRRVRKEIVPPLKGPLEPERVRVVQFLWDGDVLAQEVDSEKGKRVYVHEPESFIPLLQQERGEVLTYVNDQVGTPKELVDAAGALAWSAAHSPWGSLQQTSDGSRPPKSPDYETPFRLLGQYYDEESGLCHTRFRYFDAAHGRWISPESARLRWRRQSHGVRRLPNGRPRSLRSLHSSRASHGRAVPHRAGASSTPTSGTLQ